MVLAALLGVRASAMLSLQGMLSGRWPAEGFVPIVGSAEPFPDMLVRLRAEPGSPQACGGACCAFGEACGYDKDSGAVMCCPSDSCSCTVPGAPSSSCRGLQSNPPSNVAILPLNNCAPTLWLVPSVVGQGRLASRVSVRNCK